VVIISSKEPLAQDEKAKFELWLKTKLKLERIQILQEKIEIQDLKKSKR
jgi:hypothetical protein